MHYFKANTIVLKKTDYGDSSLILTGFSREFGKIVLSAKGIKRSLSNFESPPEALTVHQFVFSRRGSRPMGTASESALLEEMRGVRSELARYYAACCLAEILLDMCPEWDPAEELYDLALTALREIDHGEAVMALLRFEAGALCALGHAPIMDKCANCRSPRKKAQSLRLSAKCGGYLCLDCAGEDPKAREIQGGTAAAMDVLLRPSGEKSRSLRLSAKARLDLQRAFDYLFLFLREKPSRAMPLFERALSKK